MQKFQKNCKTLFSDLLENSNDMLFIFDVQGESTKIMYANKAAVEKSGYTLDEMNEIGIENFRRPTEESKEFKEHIKELKEKGSMFDYAVLVTKDKREIPVEANVKIVKTEDSVYNIAVVRDISERVEYEKRLKIELHEKTKLLRENISVLKSYQDAIDANSILTISDPKGIITYANDNFCKLSGYSKEEVLGKPHNIVRHEETPSEVFKDLWNTIRSKRVWRGRVKNKKKNSDYYIVDTVIAPILDSDSNIKEYLSIRYDVTQIVKKQKKIQELAHTDILTGTNNRLSLNKMLISCKKEKVNIALIDINRFHEINDFYGENIGDKVIKKFAKKIHDSLDEGYKIFHLQGDEFIVLNISLPQESFVEKMLHLNASLSNQALVIENKTFNIDTTLALSFEKPQHLLSTVSLASRYAKHKGLSYNIYTPQTSFEDEYKSNIEWTYKIRKALNEDRFTIFFQPIIDTKTKEIFKYEALVRMIDEDEKIISPFFFLDKAKKSNQYTQITKVVIEKAMQAVNERGISCGINITLEDIESEATKELIFKSLQKCKTPQNISFELVESEGIEKFEEVDEFIKKVKSYGCSLSIDDFGTGYSNFEYLLKLNADTVKIDGSLIKDIDTNQDKYDIVKTIVMFAKIKKLSVVAEFVSSESIYKTIDSLDIDFCQGYYFGEPKPLE